MKSVNPRPNRGMLTFSGVTFLSSFFTTGSGPGLGVTGFGRRRLGLTVAAGLLLLGAALGRVVRNAPRMSSSCCAKTRIGAKPASAINKLKKMNLLFIVTTSPYDKYASRGREGFICVEFSLQREWDGRHFLACGGTFTVTKGASESLSLISVTGSLVLYFVRKSLSSACSVSLSGFPVACELRKDGADSGSGEKMII